MLKKIISVLLTVAYVTGALSVLGATAACNTVHGAGQDIENGGAKIKQESDEHK